MSGSNLAIIGGDQRQKKLTSLLAKDGYTVKVYGLSVPCSSGIKKYNTIKKAIHGCSAVIGAIPFSKDNNTLFFFENAAIVTFDEFFNALKEEGITRFFAGVISSKIKEAAAAHGITATDILELDEMAVLNAIPTAEGAVQIAMQESKITIFGSRCLVLGYGRCGKILAHTLKALGADVQVTYRRAGDGAYIRAYGYTSVPLASLDDLHGYDFVFNTIPHPVITKDILERSSKHTLIIDLAQAPGGVDFKAAGEAGVSAMFCPGLPGIVAPNTAAKIIKETILELLKGED